MRFMLMLVSIMMVFLGFYAGLRLVEEKTAGLMGREVPLEAIELGSVENEFYVTFAGERFTICRDSIEDRINEWHDFVKEMFN